MTAGARGAWRALGLVLGSALAACAADTGGADAGAPSDAPWAPLLDTPRPDAPSIDAPAEDGSDAPLACDGALDLGHCRLATTGGPCEGRAGEPTMYVPVEDGAPISVVLGPQGARMLALAGSTLAGGFEPGDPTRPADSGNPVIDVHVVDAAGVEVAAYRGRAAFVPDPSDATYLVRPELFVITEHALSGTLEATATVRDRNGVERCGRLALTIAP